MKLTCNRNLTPLRIWLLKCLSLHHLWQPYLSLTQKYLSCTEWNLISSFKQKANAAAEPHMSQCVSCLLHHTSSKGGYFSAITWLTATVSGYLRRRMAAPNWFISLNVELLSSSLVWLKTTALMNRQDFIISTCAFLSEVWTLSLFIKGCKTP